MAVTIRQVAKAAGVSVGTVSRTLNAPQSVKATTLAKVRAVIDELGFEPDQRAQNMRRQFTMTVGYVVNDISIPNHARVFRAMEGELRERGYTVYLTNTGGDPDHEAEAIRKLQRSRVDGIVLSVNSEENTDSVDALRALRVPAVLFDRELPIPIDSVVSQHAAGVIDAMDYLVELGHRRIGLVTAGLDVHPGRDRRRGYLEACRRNGLEVDESLIRTAGMSVDIGMMEALALLSSSKPPTAIIAGGTQIQVGVLRAANQMKLTVGRDISLIGTDRTDVSTTFPGTLTIVDRDLDIVGRSIAHLLIDRISGKAPPEPQQVVLPTYLTLGRSCGPPPVRGGKS